MKRFVSIILSCSAVALLCLARDINWQHLTSKNGELPVPGTSTQQTGLLVAKIDRNSAATDFVVSCRQVAPALIWYRHTAKGWDRYVIEKDFLKIEAGGAAFDIDGDGDLDIVFGDDATGNQLYWWENPYPNFDPNVSWKRHIIKNGGANQHHDQIFADFKGTGKPQLAFWNQKAKSLFLADIPADPRTAEPWPLQTIFSGQAGEDVQNAAKYAEGIDAFDVDGDGRVDLLAGNYWFKYEGGNKFRPIRIGEIGGRIRAGKFKPGKYAQIVIGPGDGTGPLMFYEAKGDPTHTASWTGRNLLGRDLIHGHTLDVGDIDGDGNLDIFAAEMAKWSAQPRPDNPEATAWILYGDGKGNFRTTVLAKGDGWHEGKLADVDGDGDLDIINKPYTWEAPRIDLWLNNGTANRTNRSATAVPVQHDTGMELWTYRQELARDLPGTLALIRKLGFTDVETASYYGRTAGEFRKILDAAGLKCSSIIAPYDKLAKNLDRRDRGGPGDRRTLRSNGRLSACGQAHRGRGEKRRGRF